MCDNRELDRLREQRDDAIGRAVDAAGQLADTTAEADRLRAHSVTLNAIGWRMAEALGDVGPDDTEVVSDPEGRLTRLLALLAAQ